MPRFHVNWNGMEDVSSGREEICRPQANAISPSTLKNLQSEVIDSGAQDMTKPERRIIMRNYAFKFSYRIMRSSAILFYLSESALLHSVSSPASVEVTHHIQRYSQVIVRVASARAAR